MCKLNSQMKMGQLVLDGIQFSITYVDRGCVKHKLIGLDFLLQKDCHRYWVFLKKSFKMSPIYLKQINGKVQVIFENHQMDECIICAEAMKSNFTQMPCGHFFHINCIHEWVTQQPTCPMCRCNLSGEPLLVIKNLHNCLERRSKKRGRVKMYV